MPTGEDEQDPVAGMDDTGEDPGRSLALTCDDSANVEPRLYRVSSTQYANALQELLGLSEAPTVAGDTEATLLFYPREDAPVQASVAEGFSRAAREALATLDLEQTIGCGPLDAAGAAACAQSFIEDLASRAFRRPLDASDREALITGEGSPFVVGSQLDVANGVSLALEAILNAPSFVYRREFGGQDGRLSSLETAEQLGFLLRDSLPDDELWQAALADELVTDEQIGAQIDRMLLDPLVQANVTRIVGAWFGVDRVNQVSKDPDAYPGFNDENMQAALFESSRRFIDDALWNDGGGLPLLLESPKVYLNASLANAYGLDFPGDDPEEFVAYDMTGERSGILTQPALMAAYASSLETSVVKRGLFIVRRALCLPKPPPPTAAIFALATAQAADFSLTEKEKAEYRADPNNPCAGCHGLIDPYGLVFENYDAIGRFRETFPNGDPVDASSTMQEGAIFTEERKADDEDFTELVTGAAEFVNFIGETDQFAFCASRQLSSYALGREVSEVCIEEDVEAGLITRDMTIGDVIRNVVLDELTRTRRSTGDN